MQYLAFQSPPLPIARNLVFILVKCAGCCPIWRRQASAGSGVRAPRELHKTFFCVISTDSPEYFYNATTNNIFIFCDSHRTSQKFAEEWPRPFESSAAAATNACAMSYIFSFVVSFAKESSVFSFVVS
jgi:hypothetical protein